MTTCRTCHKQWSGERTGHCTRCHETFTTLANFDQHLVIERGPGICKVVACTPPAEVVDKHGNRLLFERKRANGTVWSAPGAAEVDGIRVDEPLPEEGQWW